MSPTERDLLNKLYANSQETVLILDQSRKILVANPRAQEDTSYELEELVGQPFLELFLPEERAAIDSLLEATLQWNAGTDPRRTLKRKSGKKIIVEISTMSIDFEGSPAIACSLRDITDRVRDEEKIRQYSQELEKINAELEERVKARTQELTHQKKELEDVMNNIQEAILTVGPDLTINPGVSSFAKEVFGLEVLGGERLPELLMTKPEERENLSVWLKQVFEQPEMWEVVRDFGPSSLHYPRASDGLERDLRCEWRPIHEDGHIVKMMLVCQDITEQKKLEAEISRREAEHREELELIAQLIDVSPDLMDQFVRDFEGILKQGEQILQSDQAGDKSGLDALLRHLHTFKGASRQVGLRTLTSRAHHLEELAQTEMPDLQTIRNEFADLASGTQKILEIYRKVTRSGGDASNPVASVHIEAQRVDALAQRLGPPLKHGEDLRKTLLWLLESPTLHLLQRLEELAKSTSQELGKGVEVHVSGGEERIDQRVIQLLSSVLPHAVRNSIDHGSEPSEVRVAAKKPEALQLRLSITRSTEDEVRLTIEDDGAGVDLEKVRTTAVSRRLVDPERAARAQPEEVLRYLLLPGLSTRTEVSELSGRGVGLDALDQVVSRSLHGKVEIESTLGRGTRVSIVFRADALAPRQSSSILEHSSAPTLAKIEAFQSRSDLEHWIDPETPGADYLRLLVGRASGFSRVPGLEFFLEPGTTVHSSKFLDYGRKATVIGELAQGSSNAGHDFASFDQVVAELGEELLMNAFFDAPRDASGKAKYASRSRRDKHVLEPWEAPTLRWGYDSQFVAVSIEDPFGALTRETFFKYLEKGYRQGQDQIDRKPGGAGLGLYTLLQLSHWLGVVVESGRRTEMTCLVERGRSFEAYQKGAKSLSFWDRT